MLEVCPRIPPRSTPPRPRMAFTLVQSSQRIGDFRGRTTLRRMGVRRGTFFGLMNRENLQGKASSEPIEQSLSVQFSPAGFGGLSGNLATSLGG